MNSHERRKKQRKDKRKQPEKDKTSFWIRLLRAAPFFLVSALLTFLYSQAGTFTKLESTALDLQMQLQEPPSKSEVAIVKITNEDYQNLFGKKSPLKPEELQKIINAIALGKPKAIGVDIITSAPEFQKLTISSNVPIIWARSALYSNKDKNFYLNDVLGGRDPSPIFGLTTIKEDSDGVLRRYQRVFKTESGTVPSFPWEIFKQATGGSANRVENDDELFINFAGTPKNSNRITYKASQVITMSEGEGWQTDGPLEGKIVLLGGDYAVQDEHNTPLGWMSGVEVQANVVETELHGGGKRPAGRVLVGLFQLIDGLILLLLFQYLSFRKAVIISLLAILPLSIICSLITYGSLGFWAYYILVLLAVLFQQIYERLKDYKKELATDAVEKLDDDAENEKKQSNSGK